MPAAKWKGKKCVAEGCERPASVRALCDKHYQRWAKHGDPTKLAPRRPAHLPTTCTINGCTSRYHSKGLCVKHWGRWKKYGDPNAPVTERNLKGRYPHCTYEGCARPHEARGLCGLHYGQTYRRVYRRKHYEANKERALSYSRQRAEARRRATPPWQDRKELRDFYLACPKGHHVDHIIPLQNPNVRGLNVPWNLQYLPAQENLSKSNKIIPQD